MRHQWSSVPTVLIVVVQLCAESGTSLYAAPPSMEEMRKEWSEAERATLEVEGEYKFYHIKKYVKEALDKSPVEAGIPFVSNGYLWRSQSRFRTNYASPYSMSHDVLIVEPLSDDLSIVGSLAIEGDRLYEFWGRSDTMRGSLEQINLAKSTKVVVLRNLDLNYGKVMNYNWGQEGRSYFK